MPSSEVYVDRYGNGWQVVSGSTAIYTDPKPSALDACRLIAALPAEDRQRLERARRRLLRGWDAPCWRGGEQVRRIDYDRLRRLRQRLNARALRMVGLTGQAVSVIMLAGG
jgi:hypothetical protein